MTDQEFNGYSINQINALIERKKEEDKRQEYLSALICSVLANINRGKGKSFNASDFMQKEEKKKQNISEMVNLLKAFTK